MRAAGTSFESEKKTWPDMNTACTRWVWLVLDVKQNINRDEHVYGLKRRLIWTNKEKGDLYLSQTLLDL